MPAATSMPAGALRHRVTIQRLTRAGDGQGGHTETWADLATVWAAVAAISGRERYAAGQVVTAATHTVTIRHRTDVRAADRVLHDGKAFRVAFPSDPEGRRVKLVLLCTEERQA